MSEIRHTAVVGLQSEMPVHSSRTQLTLNAAERERILDPIISTSCFILPLLLTRLRSLSFFFPGTPSLVRRQQEDLFRSRGI